MRTRSRARGVAATIGWLAPLAVVLGTGGACTQLKGSLGEQCLKGEDCNSGICEQLHCAAAPTLFDAEVAVEAGGDATAEAATGQDATSSADAKPESDANGSRPDGSTADAGAHPDATTDAAEDSASPGPDGSELDAADSGDAL